MFVVSSAIHIFELYILILLQENIDTVTAERFETVGDEDCIKIKTEENCIQLLGTVKREDEVSVFCGSDLFTGVRMCVIRCLVLLGYHIFSTRCLPN